MTPTTPTPTAWYCFNVGRIAVTENPPTQQQIEARLRAKAKAKHPPRFPHIDDSPPLIRRVSATVIDSRPGQNLELPSPTDSAP